ncbi:Homeobox protein DLX-4 [Entophlyctis luteolus]|nr:Homeobox protein DLX-4 [Entophlyctis luteolus]
MMLQHFPHRNHPAISPLDELFFASSTATSASTAADISVSGDSLYSTPASCSPSVSHELLYDQQPSLSQRDLSSLQHQRAFSNCTDGNSGSIESSAEALTDAVTFGFAQSPLPFPGASLGIMGIAPFGSLEGFFAGTIRQQQQHGHFATAQPPYLEHQLQLQQQQQLSTVSPSDAFFGLQQHYYQQQQQPGLNQKQQPHPLLQHQPLALYPSPLLSGAEPLAHVSPMLADSASAQPSAASVPAPTCLPLSMLSPTPPGLLSVAYGSTTSPTTDVPSSTFLDSDESDDDDEEDDQDEPAVAAAQVPAPAPIRAASARSASTSSITSASSQTRNGRPLLLTMVKRSNSGRNSSSACQKPYSRPTPAVAVKDDAPAVAATCFLQQDSGETAELRKPKKRHILQDWETEILNKCFEQSQFLQSNKAQELSAQLGMTVNQVRIWFQNKRAYVKRQAAKNEEDESDG